jgi:hypothetical protein
LVVVVAPAGVVVAVLVGVTVVVVIVVVVVVVVVIGSSFPSAGLALRSSASPASVTAAADGAALPL